MSDSSSISSDEPDTYTTDAIDLSALDLAGKVTIGAQVTWGGFSNISRGSLLQDGIIIEVAVKTLRVQGNAVPETKERLSKRFHREVILWRRLEHLNVVPLLGYTMRQDEFPSLISPWYINGNIIEYIALNPTTDRRALAIDVVSGLEYLRSIPVAHGDLKGENVLVNQEARASLCDFGMSQFMDEASKISGFTTTNAYIGGTDRFLCPELLEDEPKSPATDMWALGCLVVQILTGNIPYSYITKRPAVLSAILRGHPPMTNSKNEIEGSLWQCIRKCWRVKQGERPKANELGIHLAPHVDDLTSSLRRLVCSEPIKIPYGYDIKMKFSADGKYLAVVTSGPDGGTINIWKPGTDAAVQLTIWTSKEYDVLWEVIWSPSHRYLLVGTLSSVMIFVVETGELLVKRGKSHSSSFSPSTETVTFCDVGSDISVQDLTHAENPVSKRKFGGLSEHITGFHFFPDHQRAIILAARPDMLYVFNLNADKVEAEASLESSPKLYRRSCSLSKDGRSILIASNCLDPEIWWMDISEPDMVVNKLSLLHRYKSGHDGVESVQFGGVQEQLILGTQVTYKQDIFIWDRSTAELIHVIPTDRIRGMSFTWNSADPNDMILAINTFQSDHGGNAILEIWSVPPHGVRARK